MKAFKYILFLILATASVACEDFLDREPLSNVTVGTFFKSEADIQQFADGLYASLTPGTGTIFFDFCTDLIAQNQAKAGNRPFNDLIYSTYNSNSSTVSYYWDYAPIRSAYILLSQIPNVAMRDDSRNLYTGTAQYLLAYRYYMMFRAYENVPIVREVMTVENADIPASPKEEVFKEALTQINNAIENLPSLGPDQRERGRLTKLVALMLKADLLLYTSSRYEGSIAGASYVDAANAADAALKEADNTGYGLADDYQKMFISAYQAEVDAQKEIIFEQVKLKDIATDNFCVWHFGPRHEDIGWGDFSCAQETIDRYECTDGNHISKSSLYDPERPFNNRDPRLGLTTLYPGTIVKFMDGDSWVSNTLDPSPDNYDYMLSTYNTLDRSPSGYINIKYWDRMKKGNNGYGSFIVYRYGELLLMYAEAMNEAYGPSDQVYQALSKLRGRTGINMPAVNATTHPGKDVLREFIRNERIVELLGEGKRYWDIRRWGIGETLLNKSRYSMHISKFNPDGTLAGYMDKIYVRTSLTDPTKEELFEIPDGTKGGILVITGVFNDKKYYVWPIPQSAIDNSFSHVLEQHPLWAN